ncbi:MAG: ABC transporter permease [Candidatus Aminicenantes bacterium]|nr:ABC transporter permease [Candidatus Aminicenantes bacterium]
MKLKILFSLLGTLLILFIVVPLVRMIVSVDPADLAKTAIEPDVLASIVLTLRASLWATLAAFLLGIPLAFILARSRFFGQKIIEGLIDIPVIIPHTAAGIALLMVWGRQSLFTRWTGISIVGTEAAVSIGMFFVSVPFLINSAKAAFRLIDVRFEKTAISLGASPWQAFKTVSLPMTKKAIISGGIMMWARGISEFGAVVVLAYHPMTASVLIFERFQNFGLRYAAPVTVLLILISLVIFTFLRILEDRR